MPAKTKRGKKNSDRALISLSLYRCVREFFQDIHGRVVEAAMQGALERGSENGRCFVSEEDILTAARSLLSEATRELENTLPRSKPTHVQRRAS